MASLIVTLQDGTKTEIKGRRFSHYVQNQQFWFLLHEAVNSNALTVTHWDSGKKVLDVSMITRMETLDDKKAAKADLDKLIQRHGAARVRSVLAGA